MRRLTINVTLATTASLVAAPLVAVPAHAAIGVVARDIPGVPPTDPPSPPPPPTPEPTFTPAPYDPDPGYTAPPEYLRKPGEIAKMRLSFKEVATKGRMSVSWSSSERATSYEARITKVVLQLGTTGPKYKKAKPQPWKQTGKRAMNFDVASAKRYRIQVRGTNSAGAGPIIQQIFVVP